MKKVIKNISHSTLSLFARINGMEAKFEIGSGKTLVVDNHETRIIKIYKKKGLITMLPYTENVDAIEVPEQKAALDGVNKGSVADIDVLHEHAAKSKTAESISDIEYLQKNLFKSLQIPHDSATRLEVVEGEVKQYVEDGFIKGAWSDEDIAFLRKNYPTKGRNYCSIELNRNESSVQKKINSLGLKKRKKKK